MVSGSAFDERTDEMEIAAIDFCLIDGAWDDNN